MEARGLGIRTIAIDGNPTAPGLSLADSSYVANILDPVAILEIARQERVNGILTICIDSAVRTIARVASTLGLPGLSVEAANRVTDKRAMRRALASLPSSLSFSEASDLASAERAASRIGFPVAVKAPCSSGSRGVTCAGNQEELAFSFHEALSYTPDGRVLIEEWAVGPELSVEGVCYRHQTAIVQITDKLVFDGPYPVESGHTQPSSLSQSAQLAVKQSVEEAIAALGLDNCAFHAELKFTDSGPRLMEVGARLGGDRIATHLTPLSTGVNLVGAAIELALGRIPDLTPTRARGSAIRYFIAPRLGELSAVSGIEWIRRSAGCEFVFAASERDGPLQAGFKIPAIKSSLDRYGHVVFSGADSGEAVRRADAALQHLHFEYRKSTPSSLPV